MIREWDEFWQEFLDERKLNSKIRDLDIIDGENKTYEICYNIYSGYEEYSQELDDIRLQFVREIEHLPGVHLQTSRVKSIESILEKVINKRYSNLLNKDNLYATITSENYSSVITDLVGVRIIISYRGKWNELHRAIVSKFPYKSIDKYKDNGLIAHEKRNVFLAEIPKAYYADGDNLSMYRGELVKTYVKESGYRSVHYVISYKNTYIELQTRTIYDEAWSDCDHSFVYKKDFNRSYQALTELSKALCKNTNASNDLGDVMHIIYDLECITENQDEGYICSNRDIIQMIDSIIFRYSNALHELRGLREKIKEGTSHE